MYFVLCLVSKYILFAGVIPGNSRMVCGFECTPCYDTLSSSNYELHLGSEVQEDQYIHFTDITCIIKVSLH